MKLFVRIILVVVPPMFWLCLPQYSRGQTLEQHTEDAGRIFQTAYALFLSDMYEEANTHFQQLILEDPDYVLMDYVYLYQAKSFMKTDNYAGARKILQHVRANYPQSVLLTEARFLEADSWFYEGNDDRAIREYLALKKKKHYRKHELMPECFLKLGQSYEHKQQFLSAIATYHQARLDYITTPVYSRAKEHEAQVAARFPGSYEFYTTQRILQSIDALIKAGKADDALEFFAMLPQRSLSAALQEQVALKRAYTYYILRDNLRAKAYYRQFLRDYPRHQQTPYILDRIARIYLRQNNMKGFQMIYDRLLQEYPTSRYAAEIVRLKGKELELQGKFTAALDEFHLFLKRYPKGPLKSDVLWHSGLCHYQLQHYQTALKTFERFLRSYPKSSHNTEARYWAGRSAEQLQQFTKAAAYYQKIVSSEQNSYFGILSQRAFARIQERKPDIQIQEKNAKKSFDWQEKVEFTTNQGKLHRKKAEEFLWLQLYDLAAQELAYAIEQDAKTPTQYLALAQLYALAGNYHQLVRVMQRQFWYWILLGDADLPRKFWQLAYPQSFPQIVNQYAASSGVDPYLIQAIMLAESVFDPEAISPAGAMGLMQLMPYTGDRLAEKIDLKLSSSYDYFRPDVNILLGTTYLQELSQLFAAAVPPVIASYNAGEHRVHLWWKEQYHKDTPSFIAMIPYAETWKYVQKVLWYYREYHRIYGKRSYSFLQEGDSR